MSKNQIKIMLDQLRSVLPVVVHVILRILLFGVRKIIDHYACDCTICDEIIHHAEEQKGEH